MHHPLLAFPLEGEGVRALRSSVWTEGGMVADLRARRLRSQMTEGERKLWWLLRRKQLSGFRFRRQAVIGRYIADFFCPQAKLIIEVDGAPHADEERGYRDLDRTRWLEARGYRVIRFWNVDVFKNSAGVTEAIYHALTHPPSAPSGHLPPQGGKAKTDGLP